MKRCTLYSMLAMIGLLAQPGLTARAQSSYSFRDLGTLGGTYSNAQAVSNLGQVVGYSFRTGGTSLQRDEHAFYWANGMMTDLSTLGGTWSEAYAINNGGDVVGRSATSTSIHAFLWNSVTHALTDLNSYLSSGDSLNWKLVEARGINDTRQVVGSGEVLINGVLYVHAYLLNLGTTPATLTDLGSSTARGLNNLSTPQIVGDGPYLFTSGFLPVNLSPLWDAMSINNSGQIVGSVNPPNPIPLHPAYRAPDGSLTDLGTFTTNTAASGIAYGINNASPCIVVGYASALEKNTLLPRAFRWSVGSISKDNLNNLTSNRGAFTLRSANRVSDSGYIVGTANSTKNEPSNYDRAFLLSPNP